MKKVMFFVDGYNLYHAIKDMAEGYYYKKFYIRPNPIYNRYKWLDFEKLCNLFINKKNDEVLAGIKYFTAFAQWKPQGLQRHKLYINALYATSKNIEIIHGKFKEIERYCKLCNRDFKTHIEKQTDVNIAIYLFEGAFLNKYDKATIISGDSDLIPPIIAIKRNFPNKEIEIIIPIGRQGLDLCQHADSNRRIKEKHLRNSQLPDDIGNGSIKRPSEWT